MQTASADVPAAVRHRTAAATITLAGPDGTPLAGRDVRVEQVRHAFGFGNIGFDFIELANGETRDGARVFGGARTEQAAHLAELWFDLYNMTTLPFYWRSFEPERGHPDTRRLHRTAQWFGEHGVTVKGHPLLWHTHGPARGCWTCRRTRSSPWCGHGSAARSPTSPTWWTCGTRSTRR